MLASPSSNSGCSLSTFAVCALGLLEFGYSPLPRIVRDNHGHSLRHSFATHLFEQGLDIRLIQAVSGQHKLDATARHTPVATGRIAAIESPIGKIEALHLKKKACSRGDLPRSRPSWRAANRGRVSLDQLKVMSAIERCRTAALGGYVSNKRLIAADAKSVTFTVRDYRIEGLGRYKTMTLATPEFIRPFLMHVLPKGFHRIRRTGFLSNGDRAEAIAKARQLLEAPAAAPRPQDTPPAEEPFKLERPCPCCGGRMRVVEVFARGGGPSAKRDPSSRASPAALVIRLDTS